MKIIICPDKDNASVKIAKLIVEKIKQFNPSPTNPYVLGLPTGSSPLAVYKELIRLYREGEISFKNIVTFNMDEYCNIPIDHPESYHTFMYQNLFNHIDIEEGNINILDGNASDLERECIEYEEKIKNYGGINLFLAGMGTDGHLAFNEPGSSLSSVTRIKTLAPETIDSNARFFENNPEDVPRLALTVGIKTVLDAKEIIMLVFGTNKAVALSKVIEGGINHMYTASALQNHPKVMVVCDEAATLELRVRTYKYFKSMNE